MSVPLRFGVLCLRFCDCSCGSMCRNDVPLLAGTMPFSAASIPIGSASLNWMRGHGDRSFTQYGTRALVAMIDDRLYA